MAPRLITLLLASALLAAAPVAAEPTATPAPRPTIGLALGSGGANGLAHIAILQVFDDLGIVPDRIVGISIGAVIGGLYAAGLPAEAIRDIFDDVAGSPLEALTALPSLGDLARAAEPLTRELPGTGEALPRVGLGSWITFNVGDDPVLLEECTAVMAAFFAAGGRLIDSSPMYGSSQATIGHALERLETVDRVYAADKVWTSSPAEGPAQIEASRQAWSVPRFDMLQVHNLLGWEGHLETLRAMKEAGEVRHLGITTFHGRRHEEVERIMRRVPLDSVQLTYNIVDREA